MPHPDADDLALLALGEGLGSAVDAHVAGCAECTAEIESFRETIGLADLSNFGEDAPRPGEHVWEAIAAELGLTGAQRSAGSVATAFGDPGVDETGQTTDPNGMPGGPNGAAPPNLRMVPGAVPTHGIADVGSQGPGGDTPFPPPTPLTSPAAQRQRWSRWAAPLAAAVVGIAVGAGAVIVAQNRSNDVTIEAIAPLTPVVGGPLTVSPQEQLGKAELVAAPTGQEVVVNAADLPPSNNSYEVWLFGDDGRMVSLGTLSDGAGSFPVPEGYNTREYRVVDVSDEPPDGNPEHSGVSLIRGAFS